MRRLAEFRHKDGGARIVSHRDASSGSRAPEGCCRSETKVFTPDEAREGLSLLRARTEQLPRVAFQWNRPLADRPLSGLRHLRAPPVVHPALAEDAKVVED